MISPNEMNEASMKIDFSDIFGSQQTIDSITIGQRCCNTWYHIWEYVSCKDLEIKYYKFFLFLTLLMNLLNLIAEIFTIVYVFEHHKSEVAFDILFFLASVILFVNCLFLLRLLKRPTTRSALISAVLILILMIIYVVQVVLYADSSTNLEVLISLCAIFFFAQFISSVLLYRYWEFAMFHYDGGDMINLRELFLDNSIEYNSSSNQRHLQTLVDEEKGGGASQQGSRLGFASGSYNTRGSFYLGANTKNPFLLSITSSRAQKDKDRAKNKPPGPAATLAVPPGDPAATSAPSIAPPALLGRESEGSGGGSGQGQTSKERRIPSNHTTPRSGRKSLLSNKNVLIHNQLHPPNPQSKFAALQPALAPGPAPAPAPIQPDGTIHSTPSKAAGPSFVASVFSPQHSQLADRIGGSGSFSEHSSNQGDLSSMSYFLEAGSTIINSSQVPGMHQQNQPDNLILVTSENHYSLENSANLRLSQLSQRSASQSLSASQPTSLSNSRQSLTKVEAVVTQPQQSPPPALPSQSQGQGQAPKTTPNSFW